MVAFALLPLLASALAVIAAPSVAPGVSSSMVTRAGGFPNIPGDNASCQKIGALCTATIADPANASKGWLGKSKECTLSTICTSMYGDGYSVDEWLQIWYGPSAPKSQDVSRWPQELYQTLLAPGATVATQQSFIDAYFSLLATVGGPFPDVSYVIATWTKLAAWTGFCATKEIPYSNLADWFQFSSTVSAPGTC